AFLEGIRRCAFEIEADVKGGVARSRPLDLLRAELLAHDDGAIDRGRDLRQDPGLVRLVVDSVLQDAEGPAADAEGVVQAGDDLLARDVLQLDAAAAVAESGLEGRGEGAVGVESLLAVGEFGCVGLGGHVGSDPRGAGRRSDATEHMFYSSIVDGGRCCARRCSRRDWLAARLLVVAAALRYTK